MNDTPKPEKQGDVGSLFQAARMDDREARDELVRRLYPQVEKLVHRRLRTFSGRDNRRALALFSTGDVTHEVFVGMLNSVGKIAEQGEEAVVRYLATAVQNRVLDLLRYQRALRRDVGRRAGTSEGRDGPDDFDDPQQQPWRALAAREKVQRYRSALHEMPAKYEDVIKRRLEHGQSFAGIAEDLGMPSAGAARKLFHYAHAKLLAKLQVKGVQSETYGGEGDGDV